ncbi:DNA-directed primase/polymerase protein [Pelomyxa schiedti]|nr:DNA-directed primase/polymerase protein [Pelomyxa schiedti]
MGDLDSSKYRFAMELEALVKQFPKIPRNLLIDALSTAGTVDGAVRLICSGGLSAAARPQPDPATLELPLTTTLSTTTATTEKTHPEPTPNSVHPRNIQTLITLTGKISSTDPHTIVYSFALQGTEPSAKDWVGLYIHNRQYSNKYSAYQHTTGGSTGEGQFSDLVDGYYDLRLFLNGEKDVPVCRSDPVLVGEAVDLRATLQGRNVIVSWDHSKSSSNPTRDWIGLFPVRTYSNKKYLSFAYCNDTGKVTLGPVPYGDAEHECRYFKATSGYCYSGKSKAFSVPNQDMILPSAEDITHGQNLQVHWRLTTVSPNKSDWVGVFPKGAPSTNYALCKYTTQGTLAPLGDSGLITFSGAETSKLLPGSYDLRFFAATNGTYALHMHASVNIKARAF